MATPPPHSPASSDWQGWVLRHWQQRGWLARTLWPIAALLGLAVRLRQRLYRAGHFQAQRVPAVVVVVGNVMAGGVGKTPVVLALAEHLQQRGIPCGLISRGYGRTSTDCREVRHDSLPQEVGDEPLLMQRRTGCPVWVARRRVDAARGLLAQHPAVRVILSDDGLQHLALHRDVEIGVFDNRGVGNGWLQPAGPLREPWPRPLDLTLHTGDRPAFGGFRGQRALASDAVRADGTRVPLASLQGPHLHALAGIGQPALFFAQLEQAGLQLASTRPLPDHYDFDSYQAPKDAGFRLICTEKDAVKLWRRFPQAWAVPLNFTPEPDFWPAFDRLVDAALSSRPL